MWSARNNRSGVVELDSGDDSSYESEESEQSYNSERRSLANSTAALSQSGHLASSMRSNGFIAGAMSARGAGPNRLTGSFGGLAQRALPPVSPTTHNTAMEDRLANTYTSVPAAGGVVPFQRSASQLSLIHSYGNVPNNRLIGNMGSVGNGYVETMTEKRSTMNMLVIGCPQVGKSLFINAYRTAVTNNIKWPSAPVGICGFYGTTMVEPFPDHPTDPSWLFIDTPGRFYESKDEELLQKLVEGVPWKTKLAGPKCLTAEDIDGIIPIPDNRAHQCIIVVPANDLIEDLGWSNVLLLRKRFATACDAENVVFYCKSLVSIMRSLMNDTSPFVVISKMDKVGGAGNTEARQAILALLGQCVPSNRIYFIACPEERLSVAARRSLSLDDSTRQSLLQLHEDICFTVQWSKKVNDL